MLAEVAKLLSQTQIGMVAATPGTPMTCDDTHEIKKLIDARFNRVAPNAPDTPMLLVDFSAMPRAFAQQWPHIRPHEPLEHAAPVL